MNKLILMLVMVLGTLANAQTFNWCHNNSFDISMTDSTVTLTIEDVTQDMDSILPGRRIWIDYGFRGVAGLDTLYTPRRFQQSAGMDFYLQGFPREDGRYSVRAEISATILEVAYAPHRLEIKFQITGEQVALLRGLGGYNNMEKFSVANVVIR